MTPAGRAPSGPPPAGQPATTRAGWPQVAQLLVVCTGNICRSPLAAALLADAARRRLGSDAPVWVDSAGLYAPAGRPATTEIRAQAKRRGVDLSAHRSTPVAAADVRDADLVLGMTVAHRDELTRLAPGAGWRIFTLAELARLADGVAADGSLPAGSLPTRIAEVARRADTSRSPAPADGDDVADPYGGSTGAFARCADHIERLVGRLTPALFGGAPCPSTLENMRPTHTQSPQM